MAALELSRRFGRGQHELSVSRAPTTTTSCLVIPGAGPLFRKSPGFLSKSSELTAFARLPQGHVVLDRSCAVTIHIRSVSV